MVFPRILALAALLAPLAAAARPPSADQPRFTAVLDDWRISYMDEPGHVHLGISIMLQGKGTFVIPSSREGQLTRLAMQDSTGKEIPCNPYQPWGTPGKLNPSHVTGSHSSSSPGSPYKTLQFSCGFRELPAPQSEWLRIRGTWTVQFCPEPQRLMLKQTVKPAEEPQTFYLDLPEPNVREDSDIARADSASNTASIQLKPTRADHPLLRGGIPLFRFHSRLCHSGFLRNSPYRACGAPIRRKSQNIKMVKPAFPACMKWKKERENHPLPFPVN